jgi:Protein of unknown function (DUF3300)
MTPTRFRRTPGLPDFRSRAWLMVMFAGATALVGCRSKQDSKQDDSSTARRDSANAVLAATSGPAATPVPAPAVTQASWAPDVLEELVAPIALYPDQLLGQILAASVNPQEVLDGGNWLPQNEKLSGAALDSAAQKAGFGPAMRALMQFPTVVDMMSQQIDWTRQLGSAFTSDQKTVLDAVQRLRVQAADVGNLKSTPQQKVERKTENGKTIVEVQPANPQVVYVPQYDPQVVYTTPPPATPAPAPAPAAPAPAASSSAASSQSTVNTGTAVAAGLLAFGVGVMIGSSMNHDDYAYPHWSTGAVYYGPRPFYPPAYVYRPVYGPAFHPAYRYAPPPGYRYGYNNRNIVVVNNNNYYNRFNRNQNLRGVTRSPIRATPVIAARARVNQPALVNRAERTERARAITPARITTESRGAIAAERARPKTAPALRPAPARVQAQPNIRQPVQTRLQAQPTINQPAARAIGNAAGTGDRGYGTVTRPAVGNAGIGDRPNRIEAASGTQRDHALSGVNQQGSGSFDRAASARGHASMATKPQLGARRGRSH